MARHAMLATSYSPGRTGPRCTRTGSAGHSTATSGRPGFPDIRVHDVRHTWASLVLEAGVPAKVVQEILGHASVGMTLYTYSRVIPALREEAAATVAGLIFSKG
jgi:integrase